jgi:hypothetical protein
MARVTFAFLLLSLVGLIAMPARAADAPDLSTPKKAAIMFAKGVESGDMEAVKASSIGSDSDYKLVELIISYMAANKELRAAAIEKFGEDGKQISEDLSNISKKMEEGVEKIDGDSATVGKADESDPMKLKKVDGVWKSDLAAIPEKEQLSKTLTKMPKVISAAAADIKAGKYKTFDEAKTAVGKQIFAVVAEQLNTQGQSTPPAPAPPEPQK